MSEALDTATAAPGALPGIEPGISRFVDVPGVGADSGRTRRWHVLDTAGALEREGHTAVGTIVAVHGNPTWSLLWRQLIAASLERARAGGPAWRVLAVDQLEMGYSERTDLDRRLEQRVADLDAVVNAAGVTGDVVTLGHDWGGPVSLGWATRHLERLRALAVLNTAIHHPDGRPLPVALRVAGARGLLATATTRTTAFLDTTLALARPALEPEVRAAYRAPYRDAARRRGIGGFVADIPATPRHPSTPELDRIAAALTSIEVPALLLRGPKDPVFGEHHLEDLAQRMPHADVHRFEGAGHMLAEERPYAATFLDWLDDRVLTAPAQPANRSSSPESIPHGGSTRARKIDSRTFSPLWSRLFERRDDDATAVVDLGRGGDAPAVEVSWRALAERVEQLAAGLTAFGVGPGDRVSLLVQPGPTLTAVLYACLRIGAVVVVADRGLGVDGLSRAVRGSSPSVIIGEQTGLAAARALGWPGRRISAPDLPAAAKRLLGVETSLVELARTGASTLPTLPASPDADDEAAILFTSGSTGPAKGVVYTHRQLSALRDAIGSHFEVGPDTGLVTGFAPFALLGPALGTRSATPRMDVSAPRTLTANAVAEAVRRSKARIVFLSPAALANVAATADALTADDHRALGEVSTFLSTGAPVGIELLRRAQRLMPNATAHTPYGMTECLLVTDVTLDDLEGAQDAPDAGVCVGRPIGSGLVRISALDESGAASGEPSDAARVTGEVVISAPHLKRGYHRLWATDRVAARETASADASGDPAEAGADTGHRWHRTGDVGHLDADGRLWIEGRLPHVVTTAQGPVTPVGPEQQVETVDAVRRAAVIGVGPRGRQVCVAVIETVAGARRPGLAPADVADLVRSASMQPLTAVLVVPSLPTDIRHNSKIDRSRLAAWAERVLAGEKPDAP
ncbi:alpha/beta fold hydrolase [Microbacterium radiodurans]|uniref:Alpha/beta fold hydrolase n=1 Tax=Microbacterium radiodurans TaxID=661398 RepID=A0A5J5ISD2_9MICO|nr:alpha/beta fold hydrolase [Microbacterium radiodurans]KAA9085371.1 alpha/beta fold hydrolase [Microbacterium radiodurans]